MERDELLEEISDKIRMGIPVSMFSAMAAIAYQDARKKHRQELASIAAANVWWRRAIRWIRNRSKT